MLSVADKWVYRITFLLHLPSLLSWLGFKDSSVLIKQIPSVLAAQTHCVQLWSRLEEVFF